MASRLSSAGTPSVLSTYSAKLGLITTGPVKAVISIPHPPRICLAPQAETGSVAETTTAAMRARKSAEWKIPSALYSPRKLEPISTTTTSGRISFSRWRIPRATSTTSVASPQVLGKPASMKPCTRSAPGGEESLPSSRYRRHAGHLGACNFVPSILVVLDDLGCRGSLARVGGRAGDTDDRRRCHRLVEKSSSRDGFLACLLDAEGLAGYLKASEDANRQLFPPQDLSPPRIFPTTPLELLQCNMSPAASVSGTSQLHPLNFRRLPRTAGMTSPSTRWSSSPVTVSMSVRLPVVESTWTATTPSSTNGTSWVMWMVCGRFTRRRSDGTFVRRISFLPSPSVLSGRWTNAKILRSKGSRQTAVNMGIEVGEKDDEVDVTISPLRFHHPPVI